MVWFNQGIPRLHGPVGQLGHPNSFSGFAVGTLPFILYLYPLLKKHWQKLGIKCIEENVNWVHSDIRFIKNQKELLIVYP